MKRHDPATAKQLGESMRKLFAPSEVPRGERRRKKTARAAQRKIAERESE